MQNNIQHLLRSKIQNFINISISDLNIKSLSLGQQNTGNASDVDRMRSIFLPQRSVSQQQTIFDNFKKETEVALIESRNNSTAPTWTYAIDSSAEGEYDTLINKEIAAYNLDSATKNTINELKKENKSFIKEIKKINKEIKQKSDRAIELVHENVIIARKENKISGFKVGSDDDKEMLEGQSAVGFLYDGNIEVTSKDLLKQDILKTFDKEHVDVYDASSYVSSWKSKLKYFREQRLSNVITIETDSYNDVKRQFQEKIRKTQKEEDLRFKFLDESLKSRLAKESENIFKKFEIKEPQGKNISFNVEDFKDLNPDDYKEDIDKTFIENLYEYTKNIKLFYLNEKFLWFLLQEIGNLELESLNGEILVLKNEKKIIDTISTFSAKQKTEEDMRQYISSIYPDSDSILKKINETFDKYEISASDIPEYIIKDILQSISSESYTSSELLKLMTRQYTTYDPKDRFAIITNFQDFNSDSLSIKKSSNPTTDKIRFGKSTNSSGEIYKLSDIIYGKSSNIEKLAPTLESFNKEVASMSYIMVLDPDHKLGKRNELELSVFLNSLSTIELSKSTPYFNAVFYLPNEVIKDGVTYKTASITQFLNGTQISFNDGLSAALDQSYEKESRGKKLKGVKSNMNIFSSPQTLNNFDDPFHGKNFSKKEKSSTTQKFGYTRANNVHDLTRPFMTIKSFTIDVAPTQGLLSFKSGKLSLVIHDRTRMSDIAPFIKPDLFGRIGAEIILSYGWSNSDNDYKENYIGSFINSLKTTEKYVIQNSSFSLTKNGEVNVELSIAMKGPIDIKNTMLSVDKDSAINLNRISNVYNKIEELIKKIKFADRSGGENLIINDTVTSDIYLEYISGKSETDFVKLSAQGQANNLIAKIKSSKAFTSILNAKEFYTTCSEIFLKLQTLQAVSSSLDNFVVDYFGSIFTDTVSNVIGFTSSVYYDVNQNILTDIKKNVVLLLTKYYEVFSILKQTIESSKTKDILSDKFIEDIFSPISDEDPFFDNSWHEKFKKLNQTFNDKEFVSFGMLITSLIGVHLTKSGQYDDIQIISYNTNKNAGLMSNKNISSLLINKNLVKEAIREILISRSKISLEGFLTKICTDFITTKEQVCYGLSDIISGYEKEENINDSIDKRLDEINKINGKETTRLVFTLPKIKMSFDSLVKEEDKGKTILRISIYDDTDNPYEEIGEIFSKEENLVFDLLKQVNLVKSSKGKNSIEYRNKSIEIINKLFEMNILTKKGGNLELTSKNFIKAKNEIKKLVPSVTYGTQNSGIIDANVTTVNESNLNAVLLTRGELSRGISKTLNVKSDAELPLQILPSKANVTMFGCPIVNFSQYLFLDFETNTTIDNFYFVTGLNHNLTPGNFTTSLTLSYGDAYGKYRSVLNSITNVIEDLQNKNVKTKLLIDNFKIQDNKDINIKSDTKNLLLKDRQETLNFNNIKIENQDINVSNIKKIKSDTISLFEYDKVSVKLNTVFLFLSTTQNVLGVGEDLGTVTFYNETIDAQTQDKNIEFTSYILRSENIANYNLIPEYTIAINEDLIKKLNITLA